MPGIFANFGRRRWMISVAEILRSSMGFNAMKKLPWLIAVLLPVTPMEEFRRSTAGSAAITSAACFWTMAMASKEMSWDASVLP